MNTRWTQFFFPLAFQPRGLGHVPNKAVYKCWGTKIDNHGKGVNSAELSYVVDEEFGLELQDAGIKTVIVDNDRKSHNKMVQDAWAKFGIKVWPGAEYVSNRKLISEFTGEV